MHTYSMIHNYIIPDQILLAIHQPPLRNAAQINVNCKQNKKENTKKIYMYMYQEIMYVLCSMVLSPLGGRTLGQRRRNAPRSRRRKRR